MTSITDLAREAGLSPLVTRNEAAFARFAALHIKELCAGVEPVYQLRYTDGRFPAYWTELTELDYQHRDPREGCEFRILYPASTVAALKARVAELETALQRLVDKPPKVGLSEGLGSTVEQRGKA
jgi:hypothetical protein